MVSQSSTDVLIVGGGPAGLTAALYLGRARKSVVVVDRGQARHAVSQGVHNFLTREGLPPASLREHAWQQMEPYASVSLRSDTVSSIVREGDVWVVSFGDGAEIRTRALLLATGVIDEHPKVEGYAERWGHSIHQCPYCHGWEMRDRQLGVVGSELAVMHMAPLLRGWSPHVSVFTHGEELSDEARSALERAEIPVHTATIRSLDGAGVELANVLLSNDQVVPCEGLFVATPQRQVDFVRGLELEMDDDGFVRVDPFGATSLPMVWAAGDMTSRYHQVIEAAAQGARAAVTINATLTLA
ncbi:MAG: NAD(P)/FAD-dependent oxidoreductase [Myxococcota bacterium]